MTKLSRKGLMTNDEIKQWMETQYEVNENGCWIWKLGKDAAGYGRIKWSKGGMDLSHRVYWIVSGALIPEGLYVLHGKGCSKACFKLEHLRVGTQHENQLDRFRDGTMI